MLFISNRQSNWIRRREVVGGIFEKKQIFGMETKKIIIDLQNIIETMRKINFKKSIVTTHFISNTSNCVFEWEKKWSKSWKAAKKQVQQQSDDWNAKQTNRIHNFK